MSSLYFSIINPVVKTLLRSPLHGMMSHNTIVVEFKGRKSGKAYSTPISYHAVKGRLHCFTDKSNKWWHNLSDGQEVHVTLRGQRVVGKPTVVTDGSDQVQTALRELLLAVPRDASHSGVKLDATGTPIEDDVQSASKRLVLIAIDV